VIQASAFALASDEPLLMKRSAVPGLIVDRRRLPLLAERGVVCFAARSASCIVSCRLLKGEL
jgi:hypothetical protein